MGYGYGYSSYGSSGGAFGVVLIILVLLAIIGSIAATVMVYKHYVQEPGKKLSALNTPEGMRSFLRFDTLLIERIVKVLYIFNAVFVAAMNISLVIALLFASPALAFGLLLLSVITLPLTELLIRLSYESTMLRIITARNTTDIKQAMGISENHGNTGIEEPPAAPKPPIAPVAEAADPTPAMPFFADQQVRNDQQVQNDRYDRAPFPGQGQLPSQNQLIEHRQATCPSCGTVLPHKVRFCPVCGTPVRD